MSARTRLGLYTLGAALVLGILADQLRTWPPGINVLLVTAALAGGGAWLLYCEGSQPAGGGRWLVVPMLLFAAAFAWRDAGLLQFCNFCALCCALALAAARTRAGQVRIAGLTEYAVAGILAGIQAAFGAIPLLGNDIRWRELPGGRWQSAAIAVTRGVLIALPLLLIFGCLFAAADAVFGQLLSDLFRIDLVDVIEHLFIITFAAWAFAGLLRMTVLSGQSARGIGSAPAALTVGATEVAVVLGLLNALFLAFVVVQVRYLFGGSDLVLVARSLTYAEYAKSGFFELVTVTALVLPMLLIAHWLLRADRSPATENLFRILAGVLIALLFVIMASALQRMRLYVDAYGLTELRLYTTVFMGWLALVFLWFVATVLRGRRERFAFGAMVAGFLVVAGLNVLNPDALITQTNAGRPQEVVRFDAGYAVSLSADAVPVLIANIERLDPDHQAVVARGILHHWSPPEYIDWRTWNYSRISAYWAVSNNLEMLVAKASSTAR